MLDSFIIGALTSLVFSIFYYGWKFFRLKEPTKKQLMTRIVVSSIFLAFNLIMIIGNLFSLNSIKKDGIGFMIITMLVLLAISIGLGIMLVKDIEKYSLHKNKSNQSQKDNSKSISISSDNLKEDYYLEYGIYLLNQFIDEKIIPQKFKDYRVIIGDFFESSINKTTKEIYICDKDNISEDAVKKTIMKLISENQQSLEAKKPIKVAPLSEKNVVNTTKYNNESPILNIISLKRLQIIVLSLICVFILFLVFYPIGMKCIFNNKIPDKTEYKTTKLTNLDANEKVYHISEDNYNYIYVEKDNKIILYRFNNSSMYSSSKIEKTGYATSLQIKDYFEDKLVSGYPTISSIMPEIIPIGVIIGLLFIVSITIMLVYIHRIAHEIIFKLGQTHKKFKKLKVDYKNEVISKYNYNKLNKQYLSELVIKNNVFMGLFKIFY